MALQPGTRLGPYEILTPLGAGGMGEVYRARDTKLNRDVAIKILPELFTADPDRLARFRREAQVLASLNHPNVGHIYGFEDSGTTHALVLELVEGPTLADRISQGPIPLDEALPIARQIIDALECAHEQGIIHRDLKPANIKVRNDGTVKVLDFGLAKALEGRPEGPFADGPSNSPTITTPAMSQMGVILGTAAYMAPEQARGRAVDRRADIWAFGVVLYEMLTGKRAFDGDDISITLASVLKDDVGWKAIPADVPSSVHRVLRLCLEKDPRRRLSAISDARLLLEEVVEPSADGGVFSPPHPSRWRQALPWTAAALAIATAVTMLSIWRPWEPASFRPAVRMAVDMGFVGPLEGTIGAAAVISPDGQTAVFVSQASGRSMLYFRRLDQLDARPLNGTEDAFTPFFSPDSQWIAFFTPGKLKKISTAGGAAVTLCDAPVGRGGWWGVDGTIVFSPSGGPGAVLHRVSAAGGIPHPIAKLADGENSQRWPQILPGGKAVLYSGSAATFGWDVGNIMAQPLDGGVPKVVFRGGFHGRYVASGHLLYINNGTLFSVPFDPVKLELRGTATPVVDGVLAYTNTGGAQFSVADNGTLLYLRGRWLGMQSPIVWMDQAGKITTLRAEPSDWSEPSFSPDGHKLAMTIGTFPADIWVLDWARDRLMQLTFGAGADRAPVWTPDGRRIAFASTPDPKSSIVNLYWKPADGTGEVQRLTDSPNSQIPHSFHPGGKLLAFTESRAGTQLDVMILPLEGDDRTGWKAAKPTVLLDSPAVENSPMFSHDGRWIAYVSDESGLPEVYVQPFPTGEGKWKISASQPGISPIWSRARRELIYLQPGATRPIMVAPYEVDGASFRAEKPRRWSTRPIFQPRAGRPYDLHRDGLRVVTREPPEPTQTQERPVLVFNFFDELRQKVR